MMEIILSNGLSAYARLGDNPDKPFVVFVPGIQEDPTIAMGLLGREYDGMAFPFDAKSFEITAYSSGILNYLYHSDFSKVIFVGASMGGLLTSGICNALREMRPQMQLAQVLWSSPRCLQDLYQEDLIRHITKLGENPVWLNPLSPILFPLIFGRRPKGPFEPDADRDTIERSHRYGINHQTASAYYQKLLLLKRSGSVSFNLRGVFGTYIESSKDDIVRPTAYEHWREDWPALRLKRTDIPHCAFASFPRACREILNATLDELDEQMH